MVKISKADGGGYKAVFYSIDQGGDGLPVTKITLEGTTVKMSLTAIGGTYEGKLSSDGKSIVGSWSQGPSPLPLNLTRATPETEWTIPPPTPKLPPMDANASPSFAVPTIKPSKPDEPGKVFLEMISFAYGEQAKQVIGARPGPRRINSISMHSPMVKVRPTTSNGKAGCRSCLSSATSSPFTMTRKNFRFTCWPLPSPAQSLPRVKGIRMGFRGCSSMRWVICTLPTEIWLTSPA